MYTFIVREYDADGSYIRTDYTGTSSEMRMIAAQYGINSESWAEMMRNGRTSNGNGTWFYMKKM